jgi:hypothetical protein
MPSKPILMLLLLVLTGCGEQCRDTERSAPRQAQSRARTGSAPGQRGEPAPESIGPQFWVYDLSEYEQTEHDVLAGLGGRWISVRYTRKPGFSVTRQQLISRIAAALEADGWTREAPPSHKYVLSRIWETASDDLHFRRPARDKEPEYWFFNQTIHVSEDASVVCLYAEVGW